MIRTPTFLNSIRISGLILVVSYCLVGCQSTYYSAMEKFGIEKRDILVDRVAEARDAQHKASEQFESALAEFTALTNFDGGDLQDQYKQLKKELNQSEERAALVSAKIKAVESVGGALFKEWAQEIKEYVDQGYKAKSEMNLQQTKRKYHQMLSTMKSSEARIQPVLSAFNDRVLFLKHNLNARALTAMKSDVGQVKANVGLLIKDMQHAIQEADKFIENIK